MEKYKEDRRKAEKIGVTTGVALTICAHAALLAFGAFSGLKYIYPPPQEQTFVIDFTEPEPEKPEVQEFGPQPQAEEVDKSKEVELVQKSESPVKGKKENKTQASKVDNFGDVEKPSPKQKEEIDKNSLFPSAKNKPNQDSLAAQTAKTVSDALKAGHASGNTKNGKQTGQPNARVKGRSVEGVLPLPAYNSNEYGTVVVTVWVNQYGEVTKAQAGADGTTTADTKLWAAARAAAMKSHFNTDPEAPALQQGTITYIFKKK